MKKILLIALIALSINAFAQNKRLVNFIPDQKAIIIEKAYSQLAATGLKTPGMFARMNHVNSLNPQSPDMNSFIQKVDSTYHWHWDVNNGSWLVDLKFIDIVYNSNNKISDLGQKWNGSAWEDTIQNAYSYDAGNYPTKVVSKSWVSGAWTNSLQLTYTYDANHNNTSVAWQIWKNSAWSNYMEFTSTYDANNNLTSESILFGSGTVWVNFSQTNYTYDANNNQLSETSESWNGSSWDGNSKYTWAYNAGNKKISELVQNWNGDNSSWDDFTKTSFNYDAGNNLTSESEQMWDGSQWWDFSKTTYTYDAAKNLVNELTSTWDGTDWVNGGQHVYTYDANKNQTGDLKQFWNGSNWYNTSQYIYSFDGNNFEKAGSTKDWNADGSEISGGDSTHYYYTVVTGISAPMEAGVSVYPNPSKGNFTVSSIGKLGKVEIYNLSGKLIYSDYTGKNQTSKEIDLSGFAKGIYVIKGYNGTKTFIRKIAVE